MSDIPYQGFTEAVHKLTCGLAKEITDRYGVKTDKEIDRETRELVSGNYVVSRLHKEGKDER